MGQELLLNCTPRSIDEFPADFMSEVQRRNGGIIFHLALTLYLFGATAIACDDFFVPSMKKIAEGKLELFTGDANVQIVPLEHNRKNAYFAAMWIIGYTCFTTACRISPDVAGATFMAAGSSAPEFFAAVVGNVLVSCEGRCLIYAKPMDVTLPDHSQPSTYIN